MKAFVISLPATFCFMLLFSFQNSHAQFLRKIKNEVKSRAENKIINKAGNTTDRAIDNTTDAATGKKGSNESVAVNAQSTSNDTNMAEIKKSKPTMNSYKNYDFVPGDKIIFEPDLSLEPDAELPARFTIKKGSAEIQTYEAEKILHLQPDASTAVEPLMNTEKYLPEQFTLEFDMMLENDEGNYFRYASDFNVGFAKMDNENFYNGGLYKFTIINNSKCSISNSGPQNFPPELQKSFSGNTWHHVAIYVRKNIGKAYIDAYRVCAVNTSPTGADKFYIKADRYGVKIKNMRLAEGGDDKYNKIVTDGKFITHGILFDVNKSSIKPESMGALNEIAKLLKDHKDLNFEIDGHTDSDGNDDTNMKLSLSRSEAVKAKLVDMGIDDSRLTTKGFGESKPIDKNDNAEGKANNRRVEFVKK
ncbi:MAG: OmpA family protein [Ginsengibacter sp.]